VEGDGIPYAVARRFFAPFVGVEAHDGKKDEDRGLRKRFLWLNAQSQLTDQRVPRTNGAAVSEGAHRVRSNTEARVRFADDASCGPSHHPRRTLTSYGVNHRSLVSHRSSARRR